MKTLVRGFKTRSIWIFLLCITVGIVFILPQLSHPLPNLLDVAETVNYKDGHIVDLMQRSFGESDRFRPAYYATRYLVSTVCQYNGPCYFVVYGFALGLTIYILQAAIGGATSILPILVVLLSAVTVDTYWRLGAAEPIEGVLLAAAILSYVKRKFWVLLLLLALGLLSKEPFVFYIPVFAVALWRNKRRLQGVLAALITVLGGLSLSPRWVYALSHPGSYPGMLVIRPSLAGRVFVVIHSYASQQLPLLMLAGGMLVVVVWFGVWRSKNMLLFWSLLVVGSIPVAAVNNVQAYYLFPSLLILAVIVATALRAPFLKPQQRRLVWGLAAAVCIVSAQRTISEADRWFRDYAGDYGLLMWIKTDARGYSRLRLVGRSEYQSAFRYLLNDPSFASGMNRAYACAASDGMSSKIVCSRGGVGPAALLTQDGSADTSERLCAGWLTNPGVCTWYVIHE